MGFGIFEGLPLILGVFLCIFCFYDIGGFFGGFEPESLPEIRP